MRTIVKYQNRKLYDRKSRGYTTLDQLKEVIKDGENIQVIDAKTKSDITYQVMTSILFNGLQTSENFKQLDVINLINNL